MRQTLRKTFALKALMLVTMLVGAINGAWAEEAVYKTALFGSDYNSKSVSSYTDTWTATNDGFTVSLTNFNNNNNGWKFVKCGRKNYASVATITTDAPIDQAITKVVVTIDALTVAKVNSISLYTSSDNSKWTYASGFPINAGELETVPNSPSANLYYKIEFDCASGSSNGLVTVSKVEYYYNTSGASAPTISADNVDIAYDATNGAIAYAVNNPVDGGVLTASTTAEWLTLGSETASPISFTCEANDNIERSAIVTLTYTYNSESVTKNVTVKQAGNPNGPGSVENPYTVAQARAAIDAGTGITGVYATGIVSEIVTAYSTQYSNITFNIIDQEGDEVFLQAYRCAGDEAANVAVGDIVVISGNLTKYGSTYEFGQGCQLISLTHPDVAVEKPTFSLASGTYTEALTIEITCETEGATIKFSLDNVTWDDYAGPIDMSMYGTYTIYAKAVKGNDESAVAEATYTIKDPNAPGTQNNPYTVADAIAFINTLGSAISDEVYVSGIISQVDKFNSDNTITYWISDDGTTTTQMEVYHGKNLDDADFSAMDDLQVGDIVTVKGKVKLYTSNGSSIPEFDKNNVLVAFNRPENAICATPTFSLEAGTFTSVQSVTISTTTEGAKIYYTTDGTEPTKSSTEYAEAISVDATMTIKAIAMKEGLDNSEVATATYTINLTPVISAENVALAYDATEGEIAYTITNPSDGVTLSANTSADWISNITVGADKVTFTTTANEGDADRVAVITLGYTGAESKTISVTQAHYVVDYAVLPFAWEGGSSSDFKALAGVTTSGLGSDYSSNNAPYLIKFDGTGDYIQIKTDGQPDKVTIGVKMIGGSNESSITIQESADGDSFTDVQVLTISGSQNDILSLNTTNGFAVDTRYLRFYFTKGSNVGIGEISISKLSNDPNIALSTTSVEATADETQGTIIVSYNNITSVSAAVKFYEADGTTDATYDWIVATVNADNNVEYVIDENTGTEARTAYFKVYTNDVYSELITISQAEYVIDYATLPFVWDDKNTPTGVTNSGVGTYSSSPYLKFDGSGDYIILKLNAAPGLLVFDIKGNGFSGGTFTVQTSNDGKSFTDLSTYTELDATQTEIFSDLDAEVRYIKWVYTEKVTGNVALGNIRAYAAGYTRNNITIPEGSTTAWGTICLPSTVEAGNYVGATFYSIAGKVMGKDNNPSYIVLAEETDGLIAGTPYIFKTSSTRIAAFYEDDNTDRAESYNGLIGSITGMNVAEGMYLLSGGQIVKCGTGCSIAANRAYIDMENVPVYEGQGENLVKLFFAGATGINSIAASQNGAAAYDLTGRRVNAVKGGLYIVNGKKVIR